MATRGGANVIASPYVTGDLVGDGNPAQVMLLAMEQTPRNTRSCGVHAYVTGDLVGDANPAAVYAALCR
jgi:hypothetical protein